MSIEAKKIISIVSPVFNNSQTLDKLVASILEVSANAFPDLGVEIILVNDGSRDDSWEKIQELKKKSPQIRGIQLSRNFGQYGAMFAGFSCSQGDAVICISADLQDPPHLIGEMVQKWREGFETVLCYREKRSDGFLNQLFSDLAYSIARRTYPNLPKGGFDFWLMSRRVCDLLLSQKGRHNFIQGYVTSFGFSRYCIPYERTRREHGKSGYGFSKKFKIFIDFVVDTSYLPIRLMSLIGFLCSGGGLIYSSLIVYAWWFKKTPFPGWAPIMISIFLVGGILMIMLGVIGEYVWRIYDNIRDFPTHVVNKGDSDISLTKIDSN